MPLLLHGDCRKYLFDFIEADSIDLTVTSPPYDNLRTYNNSSTWGWAEFSAIAAGLWRVTKPGGVVVWVVGDATIKGSETGSSFEQALAFKKMGFNLHDTMVWEKTGSGALGSQLCYGQNFEYVMVFSKGKPESISLIADRENKVKSGKVVVNGGLKDGKGKNRIVERKPFGKRTNIWKMDTQKNSDHPAPFPEQLAHDHIISWSNECDTVFDPFMGSGTTGKMALQLGRKFIGCEIDKEYFELATKRINGQEA
jgi:DNA modification methylase